MLECRFYFYTTNTVWNKTSPQSLLSSSAQPNQIVITSSDMESTYYCDWYVNADAVHKSLLFTFKNQNLEDMRANQLVIRVYDLMKSGASENEAATKSMFSKRDAISSGVSQSYADDDNHQVLANQPIYEYRLEGGVKYFQADTSNVRLQ